MLYQDNNHKNILILAESRDGIVDTLVFQMAGKGRELADRLGCQLNVLLLGSQLDAPVKQLLEHGFDTIFVADHEKLEPYNQELYTKVICNFLQNNLPSVFLLGYSYLGMELGPAVANRLGITLASNCVDLELFDGKMLVSRPMYGGRVYAKFEAAQLPVIISIQKGALSAITPQLKPTTVVPVNVEPDPGVRTKILSLLGQETSGIDITKAEILVSVGRGIGTKANIELAQQLAEALNGTVCGSRPITDMGWLPHECHVGISGRTVHPKVYIACGISGASQHVAGMRDANLIIAINKDPNAPIFRVAHTGVVGDLLEVIPALLEATNKHSAAS